MKEKISRKEAGFWLGLFFIQKIQTCPKEPEEI